jgi:mRNA interferase RelE/StbE
VASYKVVIKKSAARELESIPGKKDRQRIVAVIAGLADDPRPAGVEKLSGSTSKYRVRKGDFRVVYSIEDNLLIVYVVKVGNRKDVYRRGV